MDDEDRSHPTTEFSWPLPPANADKPLFLAGGGDCSIFAELGSNFPSDGIAQPPENFSGMENPSSLTVVQSTAYCGGDGGGDSTTPPGKLSSGGKSPKIPSKAREKGQKRIRQPRFAFMTRSEIDNLEDGYRWRKYGQKAVKNSPFPRSYFRCSNRKCTVKKRVERSCKDPSVVITTYEGQHCHHSLGFPREGFISHRSTTSEFAYPRGHMLGDDPMRFALSEQRIDKAVEFHAASKPTPQCPMDEGLLGDVLTAIMHNT